MKKVIISFFALFCAIVAFVPQMQAQVAQTSCTARIVFGKKPDCKPAFRICKWQIICGNGRLAPVESNEFEGTTQLVGDNQIVVKLKKNATNQAFFSKLAANGKLEFDESFSIPQEVMQKIHQETGRTAAVAAVVIPAGSYPVDGGANVAARKIHIHIKIGKVEIDITIE